MSSRRIRGWILAELVFAMAVVAVLLPPTLSTVATTLRFTRSVSHRLEIQRRLSNATVEITDLVRRGMPVEEIERRMRRRYPDLSFVCADSGCIAVEPTEEDRSDLE